MDQTTQVEFLSSFLTDKELRDDFKKNPRACLKKNGVAWEDKREIKVVEDTPQKKFFIIRQTSDLNKAISQRELPENYKRFLKALQSQDVKAKIKKDPKAVLQSFQIDVGNAQIEVLEDTDHIYHVILPDPSEIDESVLAEISGGGTLPATAKIVIGSICLLGCFPVGLAFLASGVKERKLGG